MDRKDLNTLAAHFMRSAVGVKPGQNIWVEYQGIDAFPLALACAEHVRKAGADPYVIDTGAAALNKLLASATPESIEQMGEDNLLQMKRMQGYIRVDEEDGLKDLTIPSDKMALYYRAMQPMVQQRVSNTRWLVTSAPSAAFARACGQDLTAFEKFYKDVCLLDYKKMGTAAEPLAALMRATDRVDIKGTGTDLSFSIKNIGAHICAGTHNIPDGECYSAPVRNSINGTIHFGASKYQGERFKFIDLTFKDGRIVEARAENHERTEKLNGFLNSDEGARYIGEFALAFNPHIKKPMGDILFDEKIDGSLHFAAGGAYDDTDNGNRSQIHWDMVHIQRPDYGGGEIWFDGKLIRKDGIFVPAGLAGLNPANLAGPKP